MAISAIAVFQLSCYNVPGASQWRLSNLSHSVMALYH